MTENKKKKKISYIFWIVVVVIIVALVVLVKVMTAGRNVGISETEATIHSGTAETSDINVTLPGAGTLVAEDASDISYPEGVDVTEWYVANGDTVSEGEELAAVDKVSVMTEIVNLQGMLESIDQDLEDTADLADGSVTATVDGEDVDVYAVKYYLLVQQRNELEDEMVQLFKIYEEGVLTAPCDGVISGISDSAVTADEDSDESAVDSEDDQTGEDSSAEDGRTDANTSAGEGAAPDVPASEMMSTGSYSLSNLSCTAGSGVRVIKLDDETDGSDGDTNGNSGDTENGEDQSNSGGSNSDGDSSSEGSGGSTGESGNDDSTSSSESGVSYNLAIVKTISNSIAEVAYIDKSGSGSVDLSVKISVYKNGSYRSGSAADVQAGDLLIILYSDSDTVSSIICMSSSQGQSDQAGAESGLDMSALMGQASQYGYDMSALLGGFSSDQLSSYLETEEAAALTESIASTYTVTVSTLAAVTPQDTMTITITVDEMDILSIEEGQTAQVTLDAFPGRSFDGVVTAVDYTGVNSGGSTKYTAEITIDREEDMLAGMNASAIITLSTENDALSIPVDALIEEDDATYVYTTYDEKTGDLGGLTEVTTGISDGENVEIIDGLDEGSEYYYSILDVVNY